jgi:hypothetical protein
MKNVLAGLALVTLVTCNGCDKGTPGGPGTTNANSKKSVLGPDDDTFTLSVPKLSTPLKQGETEASSIGIKRGKNFDQDVKLTFDDVPKGVSIDPARPVIKHGDEEVKMTFKAADNASLGDFTIKVTGHPAKGSDATNEFTITVSKG